MYDIFGGRPGRKRETNPFVLAFEEAKTSRKRQKFTPSERLFVWERPKTYGRRCHICNQRIDKLSDMELDHVRAQSKGGKTVALSHKDCNRMKSNKRLKTVQKKLGLKTKNSGTKKRKSRYENPFALTFGSPRKTRNPFGW